MSEENVEIVRRYTENPPNGLPLDRFKEWIAGYWDLDGDYYPVRKFPEAKPCHGPVEIARFLAEYLTAWDYRFAIKGAIAIGDDRVFAHGRISATGAASGVAVEGDIYHSFWLRHGRFIRVEDHLTARGALHALGLSGDALEDVGLSE